MSMCAAQVSALLLVVTNYTLLYDHRSPDTADLDDVPGETVVWRGDFTMHGMAKFSATAYAVSGPVEYLDEVWLVFKDICLTIIFSRKLVS